VFYFRNDILLLEQCFSPPMLNFQAKQISNDRNGETAYYTLDEVKRIVAILPALGGSLAKNRLSNNVGGVNYFLGILC
jgi:hypothetical protein